MPSRPSPPKDSRSRRTERFLGAIAVAIILVAAVLWSAHSAHPEKTDFSVTYLGAYMMHHGMANQLYDLSTQVRVRDSLFRDPNPLFFEHPPFEALLLSPLASLPYRTAYLVWGVLNATVWLLLIVLLRPHLTWPSDEIAYFSLWLLFAPLGEALFQGQSSLLVLAFFSIALVQLEQSNEFAAGLAIGLALIKLQFAIPFAVIMLLRGRWRFLTGFACTAALLAALSLASVGWNGAISYVRFLLTVGNNPQNMSFGSALDMPTIHGFMFALFGGVLSHSALNVSVAILSVLLLGFVAWRWRQNASGSAANLLFAAAIAATLLSSSHMFTHDFSPLILGLLLAGKALSGSAHSIDVWLRIITVATMAVFWTFPVYFVCVAWHCMYLMCPVLLVFALCAARMASQIRPESKLEPEYVAAS